jgi:hypothetical protein
MVTSGVCECDGDKGQEAWGRTPFGADVRLVYKITATDRVPRRSTDWPRANLESV